MTFTGVIALFHVAAFQIAYQSRKKGLSSYFFDSMKLRNDLRTKIPRFGQVTLDRSVEPELQTP